MIKFIATLIVVLLCAHNLFAADYYASNDVQIASVINTLQPGDTLWVKAGNYGPVVCTAKGTQEKPIQVRAQAGARVTLSSTNKFALTAYSEYVWYRGFELTGYSGLWASEIDTSYYRGNRYINLVIHDTQVTQAINNFNGGSEFYGCLVYNAHEGYGIYAHNKLGPQPRYKILEDCVFFDNTGSSGGRGQQVQVGSGGGAGMENMRFRGNVIFNADLRYGKMETASTDPAYGSYMNGVFSDNYLYSMLWWQFGRLSRNMLIEKNWLIYVGNLEFYACDALTGPNVLVRSNVYTGQLIVNCPGVESVNNLKITPAGQHVFVRPNQYSDTNDLKVGHVVVYTFNGASNVQINVSNLLETGARYSVRDVQDYYGTPVATGAYTGSINVVLPDTNSPSPRVDRPAIVNWPVVARHTPKEFNCFVIERLDAQITPPNPPTTPTNIVVNTNYVWVTNYQVVNVTNAFTNTVWQFISPVMTTNLATP